MVARRIKEFTYNLVLKSIDKDIWKTAYDEGIVSLRVDDVFELLDLLPGRKSLGHRWVLVRKDDGRYKTRLVAQGFSQIERNICTCH